MLAYLGSFITYTYQFSVILYVLHVFGFIHLTKRDEKKEGKKDKSKPAQDNPLGGLMSMMGPMMEKLQTGMADMQQQNATPAEPKPRSKKSKKSKKVIVADQVDSEGDLMDDAELEAQMTE